MKKIELNNMKKCQKCDRGYVPPSEYADCKRCSKCNNSMPQIKQEIQVQQSGIMNQINIEQDSPIDMISKLRRTEHQFSNLNRPLIQKRHSLSEVANIEDEEDNQSEEEEEKLIKKKLEEDIRKQQLQLKKDKKIFVGSGFTFDMTDFFKFKKKQLTSQGQGTVFQEISGSFIAWIILLYAVASSAIVPGWIMNIRATKFIRQAWRFLMQTLFVIPLVMYEKRTGSQELKEKYKLSYIFNHKHIIKPYISSLSTSLWFLLILTSFQWTFVSHGIVLGSLSNFFLSINRSIRHQNHQIESGGQMLIILGVVLVFQDTLMVNMDQTSDDDLSVQNTFYLRRTWWQRLGWDFISIFGSFMMAEFSKFTSDLRSYYPPFLSIFLVNVFNVFHLSLITFFFNGGSFGFQAYWGIFSIFTDEHFISFMYMAIILNFGQLISMFLIARMFPDPIIPALAMTLEPFVGSYIVQLGNIQNLPGDYSMMGYLFIFPGLFIILMGQCFFQRQKSYTEQSNKRVKYLLDEIKDLKKLKESEQKRAITKQRKTLLKRNKTMYITEPI